MVEVWLAEDVIEGRFSGSHGMAHGLSHRIGYVADIDEPVMHRVSMIRAQRLAQWGQSEAIRPDLGRQFQHDQHTKKSVERLRLHADRLSEVFGRARMVCEMIGDPESCCRDQDLAGGKSASQSVQ
jgi:hypothetical protein